MRRPRRRWVGMGLVGLVVMAAAGGLPQVALGSQTTHGPGTHAQPGVVSGPPTCVASSEPPDGVTATIYAGTNADRAAAGLAPLSWNPQLYCLALGWAIHLGAAGSFVHRDLVAVLRLPTYHSYETVGENLLRGEAGLGGEEMERAWMRSPDHRANILSRAFTSIGIAVCTTPGGVVYASENFGG